MASSSSIKTPPMTRRDPVFRVGDEGKDPFLSISEFDEQALRLAHKHWSMSESYWIDEEDRMWVRAARMLAEQEIEGRAAGRLKQEAPFNA